MRRQSLTPALSHRERGKDILLAAPIWGVVILCSVLPVAWLVWQIFANPVVIREAALDWFRFKLLARTLIYSVAVALIATTIALPPALVLGRARGVSVWIVFFLLPVSLLIPSIVYAYGWSQFFRQLHLTPEPNSAADVARCIWSLACWLWSIPAAAIGLALRRSD